MFRRDDTWMADVTGGSGSESDQLLAVRARSDRDAFAMLYDRYVNQVYRYCYRRIGNRPDAEDVTSAIFIRALERIDSFRGGSFAAWLFAIARTSVADRFRLRPVSSLNSFGELVDARNCPEDTAIRSVELETFRLLVSDLSPDQREVIELRLVGLESGEFALAMNRSVGAVKMLQFRATQQLRKVAGTDRQEGE